MIRKILMLGVAALLPATAAVVVGGGVAGAMKPAPVPITCSETGTVTFQSPGLSNGGTLTTKTAVKTSRHDPHGHGMFRNADQDQHPE